MRGRLARLCLAPVLLAAPPGPAQTVAPEALERGMSALEEKNYVSAAGAFRRAAALGDAEAMLQLGAMAFDGRGVAQNYGRALQWYCRSALAGSAEALERLATLDVGGWSRSRDQVGWEDACRERLRPEEPAEPEAAPPPRRPTERPEVTVNIVRQRPPVRERYVPLYYWPRYRHRPPRPEPGRHGRRPPLSRPVPGRGSRAADGFLLWPDRRHGP